MLDIQSLLRQSQRDYGYQELINLHNIILICLDNKMPTKLLELLKQTNKIRKQTKFNK